LFITTDLLLLPVPHMRYKRFFVYGFNGAESRKQKGVLVDLLCSKNPPLKHRVALRMSVARVAGLTAQINTARGPRPAKSQRPPHYLSGRRPCIICSLARPTAMKRFTVPPLVISCLSILWVVRQGFDLRSSPAGQPGECDSKHLERVMFADESQAVNYRQHCGSNWHVLFSAWEQRQRRALNGDPAVKSIVWRCTGLCGGLGDRQRGILTSFALALVTNRAFFIDSQEPVPIQQYFHVACPRVHWNFDESLVEGRTYMEENFLNAFPNIGDFATANLSYYDPYDVVIQLNNFWQPFNVLRNPSVEASHLHSYDAHVLAGCVLNYLLVPRYELQRQVASMFRANSRIVAAQIRTGDSQVKNTTVLGDLLQHFRVCIDRIRNRSSNTSILFLTSDSDEVHRNLSAAYPNVLTFPGQITHIDGAFGKPHSPAKAFEKVVLDHVTLSRADYLVISRSGFGEMAAVRGFQSYYTPVTCDFDNPVEHFSFPTSEPQALPATEINSVTEIFSLSIS